MPNTNPVPNDRERELADDLVRIANTPEPSKFLPATLIAQRLAVHRFQSQNAILTMVAERRPDEPPIATAMRAFLASSGHSFQMRREDVAVIVTMMDTMRDRCGSFEVLLDLRRAESEDETSPSSKAR